MSITFSDSTSLAITAFIVIVGGIVCIKDNDYDFSAHIIDVGRSTGCWGRRSWRLWPTPG